MQKWFKKQEAKEQIVFGLKKWRERRSKFLYKCVGVVAVIVILIELLIIWKN